MSALNIFPAGGFDTSIITIVFLGLIIRWILTETVGFTFVGLVVPGYLASVFVISPTNGAVIVVESVVTYLLVRALADGFARTDAWSNLFGRDRFFAFLFVSIFVRLVGEMWLWPAAWVQFAELTDTPPALSTGLNSVGLVLVPLTANMFWKVGLRRGVWQIGLPTLLVFLITVFLLDPLTNLRFSEFQVHYEDAAIDMLSSPKPYIVMLVTAAIAARANLSWGWDFGGILIPALIAVIWQDPSKALVTFGEAFVLVFVGSIVLESRFAKSVNLEGPRKVVVLFTLGFIFKFALAWLINWQFPHVRVIDYFGFGYLLSTLLALKIVQKKNIPVVVIPTILVSLAGFFVSMVVIALIPFTAFESKELTDIVTPERRVNLASFAMRASANTSNEPQFGDPIRPDEIGVWRALSKALVDEKTIDSACDSDELNELGLICDRILTEQGSPAYLVSEQPEVYPNGRGWGVYWFQPQNRGPAVISRSVGGHPHRAAVVAQIARDLNARVVVMSSASRTPTTSRIGADDRFASPHVAVVERLKIPIVEAEFRKSARTVIADLDPTIELGTVAKKLTDDRTILWEPNQRGFSVRFEFDERDVHRMLGASDVKPLVREIRSLFELLDGWIDGEEAVVARRVDELKNAHSSAELAAIERGVLRPLFELAASPEPERFENRRWSTIVSTGEEFGLVVERIATGDTCWTVVREKTRPFRGVGINLIRCEANAPLVLTVPKPRTEVAVLRGSVALAEQLGVSALLVGSLTLHDENQGAIDSFRAPSVHLAAHRAAHLSAEVWTVQVRGASREHVQGTDVVSIPARLFESTDPVSRWLSSSVRLLRDAGEPEFVRFRTIDDDTARYAFGVAQGRFTRIWLSAEFRDRLIDSPRREKLDAFISNVGVAQAFGLDRTCSTATTGATVEPLIEKLKRFGTTQNPLLFHDAVRLVQNDGGWVEILTDRTLGHRWFSFCYISDDEETVRLAVKLARSIEGSKTTTFGALRPFDTINGVLHLEVE